MIVAAGSGTRLGAGGPKAFTELAGRPMLAWSAAAIAACPGIGELIVVAPGSELEHAREVLAGAGVEAGVVAGGESRAESVRNGVAAAAGDLVLIHDAARPAVGSELVGAVLARLAGDPGLDGAIAAAPIRDTVKRAAGGSEPVIAATVPRGELWAAQTPQAFRRAALVRAQEQAGEDGVLADATDEAGLIEATGGSVALVEAPLSNLKVTVPADLELAAAQLSHRA